MKRLISLSLAISILLPAGSALAWGGDGHKTVGKIASLRIKSRTAREIAKILKPGETLANIATWADSVKERVGQNDPDPDTDAFLQDKLHNEKNREWHYDDLPLNCRSYQTCTGFTVEHDVVQMLNVCIRTLQGHPSPKHPLSKRNALKLLVHFVGDMHQPLHVGSGYIDESRPGGPFLIARDPALIKRKHLNHDKGGNDLVIDKNRQNLHGFWDFVLVKSLMTSTGQQTPDALGEFLRQSVAPENNWNPRGPLSSWGAQWATDSLIRSRTRTYKSVVITGRRTIPELSDGQPVMKNGQPSMLTVYDVNRSSDYETVNREVVRRQLAKGGFRLAKLLDAIYAR